ncbi:MAG: SLC13/DASS family transporter [Bacteroidales bacterium]|nr:SLC13/DASS family transporter [Bacteroidales bacterium]
MNIRSFIAFGLTPVLCCFILIGTDLDPSLSSETSTLAIALLMAIWWITEAVPIAVTSMLPVALFPLFGIMSGNDVATTYFNQVIFLFMGGFIIALAMQKWNLHRRIALYILSKTGISPFRILLGFMLATAFLSMWISNTATSMLMIPILLSIISSLEEWVEDSSIGKYSIGLLLGVAYSASIGGMATLIGTPPNLSFKRIFEIYFPQAPEISFGQWMLFAMPIAIVIFSLVLFLLYFMYRPKTKWKSMDSNLFFEKRRQLGRISFEESMVLIVFVLVALLWMTRSNITLGNFTIKGWASLFPNPKYINDGSIAICMTILLYVIPSRAGKGIQLMDWEATKDLPWNIILLFGGGFALASGIKESGLALWMGSQLEWVAGMHPMMVILMICLMMTFVTELTSNTATTEMILPVLAGLAVAIDVNPLLFMIPATLSGSMAFMLPVATPPNAIIFGTGRISMMQMARTGIGLNLLGAVIITLLMYFWGSFVFDIDFDVMPTWAVFN